jgi:hypothetical protein
MWLATASPATAQWYPFAGLFGRNPCPYPCPPAMVTCNPCVVTSAMVAQPVTETVSRQVPVTEYRQTRQTVRKPVVETAYVDQPITEYRQVVEQKTASVPTVTYQDVTECQTVQRNCGQWITTWHQNQKVSPCQYDNRPGLAGEMNRMGFAMRQAFVPSTYARREYQSQVIAQQIPVTRRVAVQGTKQVTYNVARLVPQQTTKRVAINTVKYVDEEVVSMQPVTVMKTVTTTQTAFRYVPTTTTMMLAPTVNNTALLLTPDPLTEAKVVPRKQSATRDDGTNRSRTSDAKSGDVPATKSSYEPRRNSSGDEGDDGRRANNNDTPKSGLRFVPAKGSDAICVTGWRPRATAGTPRSSQRSERSKNTITVAEINR